MRWFGGGVHRHLVSVRFWPLCLGTDPWYHMCAADLLYCRLWLRRLQRRYGNFCKEKLRSIPSVFAVPRYNTLPELLTHVAEIKDSLPVEVSSVADYSTSGAGAGAGAPSY